MSREKQIEEMAKDICRHYEEGDLCRAYSEAVECDCDCWTGTYLAPKLYDAGYRKQVEGEWIDQYHGKYDNPIYVCSACRRGTLLKPDINELGNMQMIQALSLFCPNCGSRMKGGADK